MVQPGSMNGDIIVPVAGYGGQAYRCHLSMSLRCDVALSAFPRLSEYHNIPCYTILCYAILYYIILYYTILYYTILYYTILYSTLLY